MADEDIRPNILFFLFGHVVIFFAIETNKTNVLHTQNGTRQRRISHTIVTSEVYVSYRKIKNEKKKISSFFLGFIFISLYFFFICMVFSLSFFSFRQLTKLKHRHSFPLVMFYSPWDIRHNITLINV